MSIGYGGLCAPIMRYSSLSHPSHYLQKYLNRALRYKMNHHLWNPSVGIRFSSGPETKTPLYPILNVSRYVENLTITDEDLAIKCEGNNKHSDTSDSAAGLEIASPILSLEPIEHDAHSPLSVVDGDSPAVEDVAPTKIFGPPSTSLPYKISPELFYKARDAKEGSPESFWSHTMYNMTKDDGVKNDGIKNDGTKNYGTKVNVKVHYCRSKQTMETTCQSYFLGESLLGFDMEWQAWATKTAGVRSNVALIQLASESHIGLFHIALFPKDDFVAPTFRKIMEDPNVSKAGVNIRGDCTRLKKFLGVETRGIFELSHLYKVVKYSQELHPPKLNKTVVSMATQVGEFLHLPIFKGDNVRSSDWSVALKERQIKLDAASDAFAAVQLYHVMEEQRLQLDPVPPRPHHAELELPLQLATKVDEVEQEKEVKASTSDGVESEGKATPSTSDPAEPGQEDEERSPAGEAAKKLKEEHVPKSVGTNDASVQTNLAPPTPKRSPPVKQIDSRIQAAELRLNQYRRSKRTAVQVGPSFLRAYYIWYDNESLNPEKIAQIMRDPPLKLNTVTGYILGAVATERLPFSTERMRKEIISTLPPAVMGLAKYRRVVDACKTAPSDL
ncbi:unnamed protein product [Clonostachys chloroleuca]|uniref:3'-5' exonuclease domain-containing protein n=1 Tax=Clonostachys chloroleuca TaxID=1926264 RepID=A0AA35VN88_9HYPO|nr:unnamed protein product [Clonostachys chloroleuca]